MMTPEQLDMALDRYFMGIENAAWCRAAHPLNGDMALVETSTYGAPKPRKINDERVPVSPYAAKETHPEQHSRQPRYVSLWHRLDKIMSELYRAKQRYYRAVMADCIEDERSPYLIRDSHTKAVRRAKALILKQINT